MKKLVLAVVAAFGLMSSTAAFADDCHKACKDTAKTCNKDAGKDKDKKKACKDAAKTCNDACPKPEPKKKDDKKAPDTK